MYIDLLFCVCGGRGNITNQRNALLIDLITLRISSENSRENAPNVNVLDDWKLHCNVAMRCCRAAGALDLLALSSKFDNNQNVETDSIVTVDRLYLPTMKQMESVPRSSSLNNIKSAISLNCIFFCLETQ